MIYTREQDAQMMYQGNQINADRANSSRNDFDTKLGTIGGSIPKDLRAIPQAVSNLEKDLYTLGELINQLRNQLHPVMRPESPEVMKEEPNKVIVVPMVSMLAMADSQVRGFTGQIRDLIDRVEL